MSIVTGAMKWSFGKSRCAGWTPRRHLLQRSRLSNGTYRRLSRDSKSQRESHQGDRPGRAGGDPEFVASEDGQPLPDRPAPFCPVSDQDAPEKRPGWPEPDHSRLRGRAVNMPLLKTTVVTEIRH